MITSFKSAFCIFVTAIAVSCSNPPGILPHIKDGLLDLSDTLTLGLQRIPGCELIDVFSPSGPGYINNVLLTSFGGRYYCMWQSSDRDEDTPDTKVEYSVSTDGRAWSTPAILARPTDSTFVSPGGWIMRGDSLAAVLNYVSSSDRSQGGTSWYSVTYDGETWSVPVPVKMADGSRVDGIFEQDPLLLPGGRTVGAVHFRPGLKVNPVFTDDPSALGGWRKAEFPEGDGNPLEPSQYLSPDGTLVMLFRDQASSFVKLASLSVDNGESWSAPSLTNIPDSRSKQCAGTLPGGRTFWVGNPTGNKSRRILVLSTSEDGKLFGQAMLAAGSSDLETQRFSGRYKTLGYNYPKATVIGDALWISLSVNKEKAVLFRIPLDSI